MHELIFPPFLREDDKVVIISPSGKIDKSLLEGMKKRLEEWGFNPVTGKYAGHASGLYAGTVKQRTDDLQRAMNDKAIKAIFCSRGGYGAVHILDKLDFTLFHQYPKWLIGYSDITALHSLYQYNGYASMHGLMARHLSMEPSDDPCSLYLKNILAGKIPEYSFPSHKLNQAGTAKGILRGGNLAVLYGLRGTPYDIPPEGTILFIEDISERPHAIERMIYNLKLGGVLEKLSGIIIGQFTEFEEDKSLGKVLYNALADIVKPYGIPVCFDFPVGHVTNNVPLICGAEVTLSINKKTVELKFS